MKLYDFSQLPFKERFRYAKELSENEAAHSSDAKIIMVTFEETIKWFEKPSNQQDINVLLKLTDTISALPPFFKTIYEIKEKLVIKSLPPEERQRIFDDSKGIWCELYPDFKRISDVMADFKNNEVLIEYGKQSPPLSTHNMAIEVFKKCISFRVKFTKKILSHLKQHPDTLHFHYYHSGIYCISEQTVKSFLKDYQRWNLKINNLYNEIYCLKRDFFDNAGYNRSGWDFYIKYPDVLKQKADEIEQLHKKILMLLKDGKELVLRYDEIVSLEYTTSGTELSLYEREIEIAKMQLGINSSDEEYCYVYTLECELCTFYVGIAANPKERFEQHVRGAFNDEAHLFKSKFIQKYHNHVLQKLVFEGTRKDCKKFERDYIAQYLPLGNMTEGGEG